MTFKLAANGMGGELASNSITYIAPDEQIRPRGDHVIVEPLNIEHSTILEVIESIKPVRGLVKAVGPGCFPLRYDHADKHQRTRMWRSSFFQKTEVKVGDIVELGSLRLDGRMTGYSFQTFYWGSKMHLICREQDISGVIINE